jgi:hypothetical protein
VLSGRVGSGGVERSLYPGGFRFGVAPSGVGASGDAGRSAGAFIGESPGVDGGRQLGAQTFE